MELKKLKSLWREYNFRPHRSLGQNFLIDKNVRDNILDALSLERDETIVEIGSGFGVMTFEIADRCGKVFAVEKDRAICGIMGPLFGEKGNIALVPGDILEQDICGVQGGGKKIRVFGNVPYYISTPIIEYLITNRRCIDSAYVVIQEEVAERIVAPPGSKTYGSISCFIQYYTAPEKILKIRKNSFYPAPKVGSCLLALRMLEAPSVSVGDKGLMFRIIRTAFRQRRKKIVNPLSDADFGPIDKSAWIKIFEDCGIDPSSRAEALSLKEYGKVADLVNAVLKG